MRKLCFIYPSGPSPGTLCLGVTASDKNVSLGGTVQLECQAPNFPSFDATPNVIDASMPPATITLNGKGIENIYGQPTVSLYDQQGNFINSTSTQNNLLFSGGEISGIQVPVPDLSSAITGNYTLTVSNVKADGTLDLVGAAVITVYAIYVPPPDPCSGPNNPCNY